VASKIATQGQAQRLSFTNISCNGEKGTLLDLMVLCSFQPKLLMCELQYCSSIETVDVRYLYEDSFCIYFTFWLSSKQRNFTVIPGYCKEGGCKRSLRNE